MRHLFALDERPRLSPLLVIGEGSGVRLELRALRLVDVLELGVDPEKWDLARFFAIVVEDQAARENLSEDDLEAILDLYRNTQNWERIAEAFEPASDDDGETLTEIQSLFAIERSGGRAVEDQLAMSADAWAELKLLLDRVAEIESDRLEAIGSTSGNTRRSTTKIKTNEQLFATLGGLLPSSDDIVTPGGTDGD